MRWDYKLVSYLLLIYFIYGIVNLLELNDFIVPLPLSFIFAIITSITFIFRTKISKYSLLYLGIPLIMLKDLFIHYNTYIGIAMIFTGIISWMALGTAIINFSRNDRFLTSIGVLLLITPILLIDLNILSIIYLLSLLTLGFKIHQKRLLRKNIQLERSMLLHSFILGLFLLNEASILIVNQ